jgi:uncharacterized membrane protein (UPF0182 family)
MPRHDVPPPTPGRAVLALLLVALLFIGIPALAGLYIDLRWFAEVRHSEVFRTLITTKLALGAGVGLVVAACLYASTGLAFRLSRGLRPLYLHDPDGVPRLNLAQVVTAFRLPGSIAVGFLSGLFNHQHWESWLLFRNASKFGAADPIFGRDVGFYVFSLPLFEAGASTLLWTLGLTGAATAASYSVCGALALGGVPGATHRPARVHLSILGAAVLAVLALEAYLDTARLLFSAHGASVAGAGYADVTARLPALRLKLAVACIGVVLVLVSINREDLSLALGAAVLYVAAHFGVVFYPQLVHTFSVKPNEYEKERPYLEHGIRATRAAFALDAVSERELAANAELSAEDIANNRDTLDNVRLWDHQPLLDTFAQIQEIRTYYEFKSVDNDRYMIGGRLRQTMLSPRELSVESLTNPSWINQHFTFTHGYGLTLGPVNEATPEGLPVLMVQDIPPVSSLPELRVSQPAIYFGELTNDHVFVRTDNGEFDYPSGTGNVEKDYDGKAGIRFDSTLMRLLLAAKLSSLELLLSNDIDSDSRVLLHRNVRERLAKVAPFLDIDPDPYMVVRADGRLCWILDAYTSSDRYPYSQPQEVDFGRSSRRLVNYIRNSVKAVIDAYDGTVELYVSDDADPILRAWRRAFPKLFRPLSALAPDLRAHLRYPDTIFKAQAEQFTVFHMKEPQLLYSREDQWEIPVLSASSGGQPVTRPIEPYYTVMRLPGEKQAEFILMLPFTPKKKQNLAAWMVARADGPHLGKLMVYRFPRDRLVFGPQQIVNRISQDAEISRQVSLWDQRGSRAVMGTLLVIPIEESLIYVQPLYLRSEGGKIPELKRVVVVYGKQIAMKPTLAEAMDAIFGGARDRAASSAPSSGAGGGTPATPTRQDTAADQDPGSATGSEPAADASAEVRALRHFERAVQAQRAGDWSGYGAELEQVEALLRAMQPPDGRAPSPSAVAPADEAPAPP